jgi:hypothetical protein
MLNFSNVEFDYDPYPIGIARPALVPDIYAELVRTFPAIELFRYMKSKGEKYSLSQYNNRQNYRRFLKTTPAWRRFHRYIHSPGFITGTYEMLRQHNLDLDLPAPGFTRRLSQRFSAVKRGTPIPHFPRIKARFEFSAMPVTGGSILPHTDSTRKSVTMVVPILEEGEWDSAWGGGTSVVRPRDPERMFNRIDYRLDFDEVDTVKTFPFAPNQCLVFVRTDTSWHAVMPMTGSDASILRKTLTINIETS